MPTAKSSSRNTLASGVVPQISVILGPSAGGAVYSPGITDFVFMVQGISQMYITGPDVIKTVTGQEVTHEELGGALAHGTRSGVAHFVLDSEDECLVRGTSRLLGFLPSNNMAGPSVGLRPTMNPERTDESLSYIVPEEPNKPYDIRDIVHTSGRRRGVHGSAPGLCSQHRSGVCPYERQNGGHSGQPASLPGGGAEHQTRR